ncbi:MAG: hypothetical protein Q7J48_08745, partial [Nocardioides sp.]|nr:hypothetical protein [Nocardioides sp.]
MAKPRRASTLPPSIDTIGHTQLLPGTPDQLLADADLVGLSFTDLDMPLLTLGGATVDGCSFGGITARQADWRSTRLRETTFER